jgi:hypothetical protein
MSRWFRHYAGMMRDEKLVRAAMRANQPVERVVWIWGAILESAAEINDGGRFDLDPSEVAYFLRSSPDDIVAILDALAALERLVDGCVAKWGERQFQSDNSAARQSRYRERRKDRGDACPSVSDGEVTAKDRDSDGAVTPPETETETETENKDICRKTPRRISYPPRFQSFWQGYPTNPGMSKPEALAVWQRMASDEQEAAISALPAFIAWTAKQGPDYRMLHAVRYLRQRRWEGFAEQIASDWRKRLDLARSRRQWPGEWGPMPGQEGCRVPADLLETEDGKDWQEWRPAA